MGYPYKAIEDPHKAIEHLQQSLDKCRERETQKKARITQLEAEIVRLRNAIKAYQNADDDADELRSEMEEKALWIVETLEGEAWEPVFSFDYPPFTTRDMGQGELQMWREANQCHRYRLRKYVRATP